MEHLSQGWWRPSPGSLYPLLEELAAEGAIRKLSDGRYELSDKANDDFSFLFGGFGRSPKSVPEILSEVRGYVSYLEDVSRSDAAALAPERPSIKELADRLATLGK